MQNQQVYLIKLFICSSNYFHEISYSNNEHAQSHFIFRLNRILLNKMIYGFIVVELLFIKRENFRHGFQQLNFNFFARF